MNYPITLPGFEGQHIELKAAGLLNGSQLLVNGQPAAKGPKRLQYLLTQNDGQQVIAQIKPRFFNLDVPQVQVGSQIINFVEPLKWYQWLWSGLPFLLVILGGLFGALIGISAFFINVKLFHSQRSTAAKFLFTGLISVVALALYLALVILLTEVLA